MTTALDISTGPLARRTFQTAGPVWATTFDLILAHTGHWDICRAIRFQIMLARTITNLIINFSRGAHPTSRQFLCSPFDTARRQHGASRSRTCQSSTLTSVVKHCLDHAVRDTSMRTSDHFSSTSTCVNSFALAECRTISAQLILNIDW